VDVGWVELFVGAAILAVNLWGAWLATKVLDSGPFWTFLHYLVAIVFAPLVFLVNLVAIPMCLVTLNRRRQIEERGALGVDHT
jgi:hypothetical protein